MNIDLEAFLPWSKPKRVDTKFGPRDLSTCLLPKGTPEAEAFWKAWGNPPEKSHMTTMGISVKKEWGKQDGQWEACWWRIPSADEMARLTTSLGSSTAVDAPADFVVPSPPGCTYLPYQRGGIYYASQRPGTLIADDMGLGKTIQAIGFINLKEDIKKVVIVVPCAVKVNWLRECMKWLTRPMTVRIAEAQYWPQQADIVIVNYEILNRFIARLEMWQIDLAIADEAHLIKHHKTARGAATLKLGEMARYRLALTGTPMENNEAEVFNMARFCDPKTYSNRSNFLKKYVGTGGTEEKRRQMQVKLRSTVMVRRLKSEVLKDLPAKFRSVVEVPYEDEELKAFEAEITAKLPAKRIEELKAALELAKVSDRIEDYQEAVDALREGVSAPFEMMAELRKRTALVTLPYSIDHLKNLFESGIPKVVFFSHHREVNDAVHAAFPESVQHYGGMSQDAKQQAVDRFQNDPTCNLFSGSLLASGMGITLTAASRVVAGEFDWRPGVMEQAFDRCHRIGQRDCVTCEMIVLEGSFMATMAKRIVEKQIIIDQALDKDRDQLTAEPIFIIPKQKVQAVSVSRKELEERVPNMDPATVAAVHQCLKQLAGVCDGALALDDMGFNGCDARIGHSLAQSPRLSPKQAVLGQKLCRKYQRQLSGAMLEVALRGSNEKDSL